MRPLDKLWYTPHTFRGPTGSSSERRAYNDRARNCIWLGLSPGKFKLRPAAAMRRAPSPKAGQLQTFILQARGSNLDATPAGPPALERERGLSRKRR
eukprot:3017655-Pyramimonas_sp.AAC.1